MLEAVNKSVHLDLKHEMNLSTVVHLGNEELQVALVVVSVCLIECPTWISNMHAQNV